MKWPIGFEPEKSWVYGRNEIEIAAPAERVWRWLARAANWPKWYAHAANVTFISGNPPDLSPDAEIRWDAYGFACTSRVLIFEPPYELGWNTQTALSAYHGWLIIPDEHGGCRVITEVCQAGVVPGLVWWIMRPIVQRVHQTWLESLKRMAESGEPL
ncbi:MAG TPA: SRPBCC domain-containing protein [Candidatus Binataceae bacterium]|nr:SRPBCC domain-containing protein [Candidatus Binataceae bacterium]